MGDGSDEIRLASVRGRWPITGRASVVDTTVAAITGGARLVLVTGEPGVGKSRVASAITDALREAGWHTERVHATSIMSAVPLGALTPLFAGSSNSLDAAAADPATLFGRAMQTIRERGGYAPVVLDVDALALLDPLSATLVAQLVAAGSLVLIASLRTGQALPEPLAGLWDPDRSVRIDLGPLPVSDVQRMLESVLGGAVAHRTASELHAASRGNALVLREIAVGALEAGRLVTSAGVWQLVGAPVGTPALRDLILSRTAGLAETERDILDRLAVCGPLPIGQLRGAGARGAVERLERSGLVVVGDDLVVGLAHPQYEAIIGGAISRLRVGDLLLEQAAALEETAQGVGDQLRVVMWRLEAGVDSDAPVLISAARLARQAGDHQTVERLAAAGARAGGGAEALALRGEALLRAGRVVEAIAVLSDADAKADDAQLRREITTLLAHAHVSVHEGIPAALAVLDGADAMSDPGFALMRALITFYDNRVFEADELTGHAAAMLGDSPAATAIIASARAELLAAFGDHAGAIAAAEEALAFARATGGTAIPGMTIASGLLTLATVQLHTGDPLAAYDTATAGLLEAIGEDDEITTRSLEYLLGRIAHDLGRLETSARWLGDARSGALTVGPASLAVPGATGLALARIQLGDIAGARNELDRIQHEIGGDVGGRFARIWLAAADGDLDAATADALAAAAEYQRGGHRYLAAAVLFALTRIGGAAAAAAPLAAVADAGTNPLVSRQARHAAAEAAGDRAELVAVGEQWASAGSTLWAAEAYSSAARAARRDGDHRAAVALQSTAEELAARSEGAMTPLLRFVDELSPLTRREREIAALAAAGASSKEIAAKLYLSTRTVDNHLQSVYGKLGISGRHELADR